MSHASTTAALQSGPGDYALDLQRTAPGGDVRTDRVPLVGSATLVDLVHRACLQIAADRDGRGVAMLRIDVADGVGTVSIAVAPRERGVGLGSAVLVRAVEELTSDMQLRSLVAEVLADNRASLAAFAAAGFAVETSNDRLLRLVHTLRSPRSSDDPQV